MTKVEGEHEGMTGRRVAIAVGSTVVALFALALIVPRSDGSRGDGPNTTTSAPKSPVTAVTAASTATTASKAVTIVDTNYPIPVGALFVSVTGSDANPGTQAAPVATLTRAVNIAPTGATIVLRGGTYRESINSITKQLTLQPYPHEKVWLDGRRAVTSWTKSGTVWVHPGWNPPLCRTCVEKGVAAVGAIAGLPDMLFVDGVPKIQVKTLAAVKSGKFFVDTAAQKLYVGNDPTGHTIAATWYPKAFQFNTAGAAASVVRGLGFIGYGSNEDPSTNMAMVIANAPNLTFENNTFAYSASRGLGIVQPGVTVRGSTFIYSGYQGLVANTADGLVIDSSRFAFSNREKFAYKSGPYASAAGAKITRSRNLIVRDSIFEDNTSRGLWFDLSTQQITAVRNLFRRNAWHGVMVELSHEAVVASNLSVDNKGVGILISGSSNVRVWNNTSANNAGAQVAIYEDPRTNPDVASHAAGVDWDTSGLSFANNIFAADVTSTAPLLDTFDANSRKRVGASDMISSMDTNVYARKAVAGVPFQAAWATLVPKNYVTLLRDLAEFRATTHMEASGIEAFNYSASPLFVNGADGNYTLLPQSAATGTGAPLPADIASAVGTPGGVAVNRGALVWPVAP